MVWSITGRARLLLLTTRHFELREALAGRLMDGLLAGHILPAHEGCIDIVWMELDPTGGAIGDLNRDLRRVRARERIKTRSPRRVDFFPTRPLSRSSLFVGSVRNCGQSRHPPDDVDSRAKSIKPVAISEIEPISVK